MSARGKTLLAGHTLRDEGKAAFDIDGRVAWRWTRVGSAVCSCGERSPVLESNAARKRWHREHKQQIREQSS